MQLKRKSLVRKCLLLFCAAMLVIPAGMSFAASKPFPQHTTYTSGSIKPNHVSQTVLDNAVRNKWNSWKAAYLAPALTSQYYVKYNPAGETVSEAHGYGMMLAVLMEAMTPMPKPTSTACTVIIRLIQAPTMPS